MVVSEQIKWFWSFFLITEKIIENDSFDFEWENLANCEKKCSKFYFYCRLNDEIMTSTCDGSIRPWEGEHVKNFYYETSRCIGKLQLDLKQMQAVAIERTSGEFSSKMWNVCCRLSTLSISNFEQMRVFFFAPKVCCSINSNPPLDYPAGDYT